MTDTRTCSHCGAPLPGDPERGCPACLLEGALDPSPPDDAARRRRLESAFPELAVHEEIGRGGMGVVYRATQRSLGRDVALKILAPGHGDDAAFAQRFEREARALARLDHPNIVRVHEFGRRDGFFFLLLEHVEGVNLRDLMLAAETTPSQALEITRQICDALQYAHDQGIVHRDIKPENVLVSRKGDVKVADFGLAKVMSAAAGTSALTQAGHVMGTAHYMAPEQVESPSTVDHRADIYSLGVVLYELLTGEIPVGRYEPPSRRVRIDARLDDVVERALERRRERRYQRAADVRNDVARISEPGPGGPPPAPEACPPEAPPPVGRAAPFSVTAIAAWVMIPVTLAAGGWAFFAGPYDLSEDGSRAFVFANWIYWSLAVVGLALGVLGTVRTRRSTGIRGRGAAFTALALWPVLIPLAWASAGGLKPHRAAYPSSPTQPYADPEFRIHSNPSLDWLEGAGLKSRLGFLLGAVGSLHTSGRLESDDLRALLARDPDRTARPASGGTRDPEPYDGAKAASSLGLDAVPVPLNTFRPVYAILKKGDTHPRTGVARAEAETGSLTFNFEWDASRQDWFLSRTPFVFASRSDGRRGDRAVFKDLYGITGHEPGAIDELNTLFQRFATQAYRPEGIAPDFALAIFSPKDAEAAGLAAASVAERTDLAELGLPFALLGRHDWRFDGMMVREVQLTSTENHAMGPIVRRLARVIVGSDAGEVIFPAVEEDGRWWFAKGSVVLGFTTPIETGTEDEKK